jgi:hypothetical protein
MAQSRPVAAGRIFAARIICAGRFGTQRFRIHRPRYVLPRSALPSLGVLLSASSFSSPHALQLYRAKHRALLTLHRRYRRARPSTGHSVRPAQHPASRSDFHDRLRLCSKRRTLSALERCVLRAWLGRRAIRFVARLMPAGRVGGHARHPPPPPFRQSAIGVSFPYRAVLITSIPDDATLRTFSHQTG